MMKPTMLFESLPRRRFLWTAAAVLALLALAPASVLAGEEDHGREKWVASWAASAHGPFPSGFAVAQPNLTFAFPSAQTGANDQTFRLIVHPDLWGKRFRLRFSNVFGVKPVTLDDLYVGLQASAGAVVPGSNRPVTFDGGGSVTIPAGQSLYSDAVELEYVNDAARFYLDGRKLAVSFHVAGTSGLMTWHAKALQTSYVSGPGTGSHGADEGDVAFPNSTTSWYFLDAVDVMGPADTVVVAPFGDSITDGTGSTLNGDDRWPNDLSRRLHAAYGNHVSVVDEGIGGNQILGPPVYTPQVPFSGGPSALSRLERDVFSLSGISAIVWLEGINDLGSANATADAVISGLQEGVQRAHDKGLKIIGATMTSSLNSTNVSYGTADVNVRRKAINAFIRGSGVFDGVADFDAVTVDPATGALRVEFQTNSTLGTIDRLHPNRAGYLVMAGVIDLGPLAPASHADGD